MRRSGWSKLAVVAAVLVAGGLMLLSAGLLTKRPETVTVAAPTATPAPVVRAEPVKPSPAPTPQTPTTIVTTIKERARPLTFRGPEGVLVLPLDAWYDTVDEGCLRAVSALIAREGATGLCGEDACVSFRAARFGNAWKVCPVGWRR